jgi:C4-dicarboxylate-specific signal transduction histidine kinase
MDDSMETSGLQFFGAMTASISHEIKNRLAIINEQAGLLSDFVKMAQNGRPLDHKRLKNLADAIKKQVSLTDTIIKHMNQFAHSTDQIYQSVNLEDLLVLMGALFKRKTENCGIRLETKGPEPAITIVTAPILLLNLIWQCLLPLFIAKRSDQKLVVTSKTHNNLLQILLNISAKESLKGFVLTETVIRLAETIGATLTVGSDNNSLKIELPLKKP